MSASTSIWPRYQRVLFRFAFVYFGLLLLQAFSPLLQLDKLLWTPLINFIGHHLLGQNGISSNGNGSGDILYNWMLQGVTLVLALVMGLAFNLLDRQRDEFDRWQAWLNYLLSLYLGFILLLYGLMKVFQIQFLPLTLAQYSETYGGSSPMRMLWTFMGASEGYTIFAGICEVVPAMLLFFRPTRTLGALISCGVMLNVFVLNLCYDVPVKLFSLQLLIISIYLSILDLGRLFRVLVLNRSSTSAKRIPLVKSKQALRAIYGLQFILIAIATGMIMNMAFTNRKQYGNLRPKSPLYGIYSINSFVVNGSTLPPLTTSGKRWKQLIFDMPDSALLIYENGQRKYLRLTIDSSSQQIQFQSDTLSYQQANQRLVLSGIYQTDSLEVSMTAYDLTKIPLPNRGFHWVNEFPFNNYDVW